MLRKQQVQGNRRPRRSYKQLIALLACNCTHLLPVLREGGHIIVSNVLELIYINSINANLLMCLAINFLTGVKVHRMSVS